MTRPNNVLNYDLRWKVALGIELEVRPFARSTLQEFRAQLIVHDQTRAIFQRSQAPRHVEKGSRAR